MPVYMSREGEGYIYVEGYIVGGKQSLANI